MEQNQKKLFANVMMVAILITAMSFGLMSCGENKEPEPDLSATEILGRWYNVKTSENYTDRRYYLEFTVDGTYYYVTENETINGLYKITEKETVTLTTLSPYITTDGIYGEETITYDAILHKIMVSGSSVFDQLWVYSFNLVGGWNSGNLTVHLYSGNKLVMEIPKSFLKY